jgi:aspartate aminotransferase
MSHQRVTDRVAGVERSKIRVMYDLAEAAGGDLVRLEVGEPDFDTPERVTEAAFVAARSGATHYTENAGLPEVRAAVADRLAADHDVEVDPEDGVVVTVGAMEALHLAMLAVVAPGEDVLVPTPAWPNYAQQARLADARVREVGMPENEGYALDPERVAAAMDADTAAVVLNSPCNPTGQVFDEEAVRAVAAAAAEHDAYVIADEAYRALTYEGSDRGIAAVVDDPDQVLTVGTCSKAYAMTGWRLGWLAGPTDVLGEVAKVHEATTACASSVAQHAALAALSGPQDDVEEMRAAFESRRDLVVDRIAEIPDVSCPTPDGAFYAFVDVSALDGTSLDVAKRLLREQGVVVAPGEGFGDAGQGRLRVSFANSADRIKAGLDGLERLVGGEVGG